MAGSVVLQTRERCRRQSDFGAPNRLRSGARRPAVNPEYLDHRRFKGDDKPLHIVILTR